MKNKFIFYTPFTGLGLYNGFRGNRWLRNRIQIFKQFVIPSLLNQKDRDFIHWISWRPEERHNPYVQELDHYLEKIPNYKYIFTFEGVCFWDDKYEDEEAHERLFNSLHRSLPQLMDIVNECEEIFMMLQPSDDLYDKITVNSTKNFFENNEGWQAVSFIKGYLTNYLTKEVLEYNPDTIPPFFAIKFLRQTFFDPGKHLIYTGPYKSHEYIGDKLKVAKFIERGFMVGTHGENISTHFNHPFGGKKIEGEFKNIILDNFGIADAPNLSPPHSMRKLFLRKLPYQWQKRLRYWWGEKIYDWFYNFIRN